MSLGKKKIQMQGATGFDGTANFNTVLYSGNGSTQSITGVGFQPDFIWIKNRTDSSTQNLLTDTVRGIGSQGGANIIYSDSTEVESTNADTTFLSSFDSNGFTIGNSSVYNNSGKNFVAWNWKAGGAPTADNSASAGAAPTSGSVMIDGVASSASLAGTIAAKRISANTASGFSIVSYTANGTAGATIGHSLSSPPELIIVKHRNGTSNWPVYATGLSAVSKYLYLNNADAETSSSNPDEFHSTAPTSSVFSIGLSGNTNTSSGNYIAYCFHSVDGYQKIGTYTGNNSSSGPIVTTGFTPRFVLVKAINLGEGWEIYDSVRSTSNPRNEVLYPYLSHAEAVDAAQKKLDFLATGFQPVGTDTSVNGNYNYLYLAIA